jgi:hypothetical protein
MYSISCYKEPLNFENTLYIEITREIAEMFRFHVIQEIERDQIYNGGLAGV